MRTSKFFSFFLIITSLLFLSGCGAIKRTIYRWGESMPVYKGNRCEDSIHCFGTSSNSRSNQQYQKISQPNYEQQLQPYPIQTQQNQQQYYPEPLQNPTTQQQYESRINSIQSPPTNNYYRQNSENQNYGGRYQK